MELLIILQKKKNLFINEEKNNEINTVNYCNSDNLNVF